MTSTFLSQEVTRPKAKTGFLFNVPGILGSGQAEDHEPRSFLKEEGKFYCCLDSFHKP